HIVLIPINMLSGLETTNVSWKVSENEFFKNAEVFPLMTKLYYYYNIMSYYLLEREDLILEILEKEPSLFDLNITSLSNTDGFFFIALTLLKVCRADNTKKSKYLSKFYKLEKSLKKWSECSPDNYLHKYYLLQAEKNYLFGNFKESLSFYEKSIHLSEKTGFIQIFALSNKLAGEFCLSQNLEKIARNYFYKSYMAYLEWGALNVANLISEKIKLSPISSIKRQSDIITKHSKSEFDNMKLDVLSLLKASQTISKEISLSELLTKLILIIKENAGAEKVFLILPKEEKLFIEAYYEKNILIETIDIEKSSNIPISIINYVFRTKDSILLNEPINSNNFSKDLYINNFKPKSVLCLPLINQGNVNGIIYMENNLSTDVFTESDLKIVNLLASQATISLENSRLYSLIKEQNLDLEEKVLQRTSELKNINDLQKGMIETIVHDLKNPLSNIIMFSKHLESKTLSEDRIKKTARLINNSSNHMAKMVENLLEISKIENGTIVPDLESFDLSPILVELINAFSEYCISKSIKIHFDNSQKEYLIYSDKTRTKQIFENLISNAIKFSPFEKNIYVKLIENEHNIIFSVRDEGYGLTDEDKKKLFKKFSRLSASPTNGEHTTGLGLSIVKKIVELMNSDVWCESEYGSGAEFFVSFPKSS
ncbi:MAG: ATP-binding protein, partial [Candidatus Sericytochromatia bacterium]